MDKKLLILGGTRISLQILDAAKKMGLKVYVADYNEDSPCKAKADNSFMTSATDVDNIVKLVHDENIDGVLMGYADVLLDSYVDICNKAGLPCYATHEAIDITANKRKFKDYCRLHGVPVVKEYTYADVISGKAIFPLIVKPVDNSGARGIYVCKSLEDFKDKYEKSLNFSPSKSVLIERKMTSGEATIFYYLHDGETYLLGVADRWMYEQNGNLIKLPVGYTFPSKSVDLFLQNQNDAIVSMFKDLNMREGMVFMQCFNENGKYVVYEMGYRLTGSIEHHLMEAQYGFNHLKAIINFAVGNKVDTSSLPKINPSECCMANVSMLLNKGRIKKYEGLDTIAAMSGVVSHHISHTEGEEITDSNIGRLSQLGLRVLLTAPDRKTLLERMDMVKDSVSATDDNGSEMFIKDYSYASLCH